MIARQRRPFRERWIAVVARTLTATACAWCTLTAPARAQAPEPTDPPAQVEIYYGMQRVQPAPPPAPPPAPAAPVTVAPVIVPVVSTPAPIDDCGPGGCSLIQQAAHSQPVETPPPALAPLPQEVAPHSSLPLKAMPNGPEPTPPPTAPAQPAARQEVQPSPTTVVVNNQPPADNTVAVREAQEASTANVLHDITVLHAVIAVAAFVIGPLASVLAVLFLLRRYTSRNGPLFRIEFVNNGQGLTLVGPGSGGTVESHRVVVPAATELAPETPSTAQRFDIGPTYEEELLQRQQGQQQQAEATLRHIFEQNLQLQQQIEALPEEPAAEYTEPAPTADGEAQA